LRLERFTDPGRIAAAVISLGDEVEGRGASRAGVLGLVDKDVVAAASTVAAGADDDRLAEDDASPTTMPDRLGAPCDTSAIAVEAKRRAARPARRTGVRAMTKAYDRLGDRSTGR
jgi:hypothetical protein